MIIQSDFSTWSDSTFTGSTKVEIEMPPIHRGQEKTWISLSSTAKTVSAKDSNQSVVYQTSELNKFLGFELSRIPEVDRVFTALRFGVFYTWIILDSFEAKVRESVYDKEMSIIDEFPMYDFDFYLATAEDQDPEAVISGSADLVYKRA